MQQNIWFKDIHSFVSYNNMAKFFPVRSSSKVSQLNALFRFSLYLSLLLYLYNQDDKVFLIPLLTGVYTFVEYNTTIRMEEAFMSQKQCPRFRHPTKDNPFMNPNLITDRCPDSRADLRQNTKKQIERFFKETEMSESSDTYHPQLVPSTDFFQKEIERKQFYTVPSSTIPSDQDSFATYLYGSMPSSKKVIEY